MAVLCLGKVSCMPVLAAGESEMRCINIAEPYFPHNSCLWTKCPFFCGVGQAGQQSHPALV